MAKIKYTTTTDNNSLYLIPNKGGKAFKGEGFVGRYPTIGFKHGLPLLNIVQKNVPITAENVTEKSQRRGYHTLGSIVGNGRFRDRGISETLMLKLFTNENFLKRIHIEYKSVQEENKTIRYYEAIVETQSLQKELSQLKQHITKNPDGTGVLNYMGVKQHLNVVEVYRMENYI